MSYEQNIGLGDIDTAPVIGDAGDIGPKGFTGFDGEPGVGGLDYKGSTPWNAPKLTGRDGLSYRKSTSIVTEKFNIYVLETAFGSNLKIVHVTIYIAPRIDSEITNVLCHTLHHKPIGTVSKTHGSQQLSIAETGDVVYSCSNTNQSSSDLNGMMCSFTYYNK